MSSGKKKKNIELIFPSTPTGSIQTEENDHG